VICTTVTYLPVLFDIAMKQLPIIATIEVEIVTNIRFVVSVSESHSTAAKTGINNVTSPNKGKKSKTPARPRADLTRPKVVADCELIIVI
jgi:hypothetical protein